MKLATCVQNGQERTAVITDAETMVVMTDDLGYDFVDMNDLIRRTDRAELARMNERACNSDKKIPISQVHLTAPIPHPVRDVIGLGLNYQAHATEMANALKEERKERVYPIFFGKAIDRCPGPGEPVPSHSGFISTLDYEGELGVIVGKTARSVSVESAEEYVFGYTALNDITGRELSRHKQNYFMKSLDGTCPIGPWIVTADEIPYPPELNIKLSVNGEPRQDGNTRDMIFGVSELISELSKGSTLQPGTIFATGSPTGIGFGMNPPVFLRDGDVVTLTIEKIGTLENTIKDNIEM